LRECCEQLHGHFARAASDCAKAASGCSAKAASGCCAKAARTQRVDAARTLRASARRLSGRCGWMLRGRYERVREGCERLLRAAGANAASDCADAAIDCADAASDCADAVSDCADAAREGCERRHEGLERRPQAKAASGRGQPTRKPFADLGMGAQEAGCIRRAGPSSASVDRPNCRSTEARCGLGQLASPGRAGRSTEAVRSRPHHADRRLQFIRPFDI
jgi:hypothetical protein